MPLPSGAMKRRVRYAQEGVGPRHISPTDFFLEAGVTHLKGLPLHEACPRTRAVGGTGECRAGGAPLARVWGPVLSPPEGPGVRGIPRIPFGRALHKKSRGGLNCPSKSPSTGPRLGMPPFSAKPVPTQGLGGGFQSACPELAEGAGGWEKNPNLFLSLGMRPRGLGACPEPIERNPRNTPSGGRAGKEDPDPDHRQGAPRAGGQPEVRRPRTAPPAARPRPSRLTPLAGRLGPHTAGR